MNFSMYAKFYNTLTRDGIESAADQAVALGFSSVEFFDFVGKGWKESIETVKDWSGSLSGSLDYEDAAQKAIIDKFLGTDRTLVTLDFVITSALTLSGTASLSSISTGASVSDKVTISCNFTGNGALAKKSA